MVDAVDTVVADVETCDEPGGELEFDDELEDGEGFETEDESVNVGPMDSSQIITFARSEHVMTPELRARLFAWVMYGWHNGDVDWTSTADAAWARLLVMSIINIPLYEKVPQPTIDEIMSVTGGDHHHETMRPMLQHTYPAWYALLEMCALGEMMVNTMSGQDGGN